MVEVELEEKTKPVEYRLKYRFHWELNSGDPLEIRVDQPEGADWEPIELPEGYFVIVGGSRIKNIGGKIKGEGRVVRITPEPLNWEDRFVVDEFTQVRVPFSPKKK